jgi:hypothetical protein
MMYSEIIAVCSEIHTKHINKLCGQNVPRSKHTVSVIKTNQLMLYSEIIAVCSQTHTIHINTLCGQNVGFCNVKPGGTYSNHRARKDYYSFRNFSFEHFRSRRRHLHCKSCILLGFVLTEPLHNALCMLSAAQCDNGSVCQTAQRLFFDWCLYSI